jgi:uncharacterized protein involved in exopolysaccharide biosynthesis
LTGVVQFAAGCQNKLKGNATATGAAFRRGFILCFALTMTAALAITYLMPQAYESFARIHLRRLEVSLYPATTNLLSDSDFVPQQIAVLRSPAILEPVIQKLHLNEVWGVQHGEGPALTLANATRLLRRRIKIRDTGINDLVEICVTSTDPFVAADVANALAEAYQDYRKAQQRAAVAQTIAPWQHAYAEKQTELDRLRKEMDYLQFKFETEENNAKPLVDKDTVRKIEQQRIKLQRIYDNDLALLEGLKKKAPDESGQSNPALSADPDTNLQARVQADKAALDEVNAQLEKLRELDRKATNREQPYYAAKRKWSELKEAQDADLKKIVELNAPKSMTALIADPAQPNFRPIKPNKPLYLVLGGLGGILLGRIGGQFNARLASGRQHRQTAPAP